MKTKEVTRNWHLVDVKGQFLGRAATKIANLLRGKDKPIFSPHLDVGDFVVVINASFLKFSGKKMEQKVYSTHSGYPGGLKRVDLKILFNQKPEEVLKRAVSGMLPKNKLRFRWLKRLYVYKNEKHPYEKILSGSKKK